MTRSRAFGPVYSFAFALFASACHTDGGATDAVATVPDATASDALAPDATVSDALDASVPDASAPDASAPDASTPDALAPDAALPHDPLSWSPLAPGPFHAGYRTFLHTYTPRGATTPRTTRLHIWYPTLATHGTGAVYQAIFRDPDSFVDAPLAASVYPAGYPVHVYSHGDQGFGGTSHFLMVYFASHGWVSIAPDHTDDTLGHTTMPRPSDINHLRSEDVTAAIDTLEHLDPSDPLAGHTITAQVMLSGHSFGTHTTWASGGATFDVAGITAHCPDAVCTANDLAVYAMGLRDNRIVAAMPMAGSINREYFGSDGHRTVTIPMFAMSGTDNPVGDEDQFATTSGVDLTWVEVAGGCHQFFALGGCEHIADSLQPVIVGAYALAFARRYVLDDHDPRVVGVLDGTTVVSDLVTYHHHAR